MRKPIGNTWKPGVRTRVRVHWVKILQGHANFPKSPSSLMNVWRVWSAPFSENIKVAWCLKEQEVKLKPGRGLCLALFVAHYNLGEGNGTPLQCSCLENPRDGGAWWAAVHGVAKSWTRLSDWAQRVKGWPLAGLVVCKFLPNSWERALTSCLFLGLRTSTPPGSPLNLSTLLLF